MILLDYQCSTCGATHESLERRPPPASRPCDCGGVASRVISPVAIGTVYGTAVSRGASDEPPPGAIDTRPLADGMSYAEWRAKRRAGRRDEARAGIVDRQLYV